MQYAKEIFNFHPDEEFASLTELLGGAGKNLRYNKHYQHACTMLAQNMALYIDKQEIEIKPTVYIEE